MKGTDMKRIVVAAALASLVAANPAAATIERFDCPKSKGEHAIVEVDRDARIFNFSDVKDGVVAALEHQPVCDFFAKVVADAMKDVKPQCALSFGKDATVADYSNVEGPHPFDFMFAMDTKALTLTAIMRSGPSAASIEAARCKRL